MVSGRLAAVSAIENMVKLQWIDAAGDRHER